VTFIKRSSNAILSLRLPCTKDYLKRVFFAARKARTVREGGRSGLGGAPKVLGDQGTGVYRLDGEAAADECHNPERSKMNERRQRRSDEVTANAVARGVNILAVRGWAQAQRYMEHKRVPEWVIVRVLEYPDRRRVPSAEQSVSEAITPSDPRGPRE
jgi:hypothetical protein